MSTLIYFITTEISPEISCNQVREVINSLNNSSPGHEFTASTCG